MQKAKIKRKVPTMQRTNINKMILLMLVFLISAVFLAMIRHFLMALLLSGIFAALAQPVYGKLAHMLGGRQRLASLLTLLLFVLVVLLPLTGLVGIITAQALKVAQSITPWVQRQIAHPGAFFQYLQEFPYYDQIAPYREEIFRKAGELASNGSLFLVNVMKAGAIGTVNFFLMIFIFLYTGYFFLIEGRALLNRILYYLPLENRNESRLLEKFTSVTRATLKGTAVIGVLQGGLAGLAFAAAGIDAAVFWGTLMTVLSVIPGIGSALIWVPAAIILAAAGEYLKAIALALFCGIAVGGLDNLLRPRLVGKDTQMHDLMIFLGTLGGLALFGLIGFVVGPIIAALFVTIWDIYGEAFTDILPLVDDGQGPPTAPGRAVPNASGRKEDDSADPKSLRP
jgi:predicted PurR-regulated permease PerM